MTGEARMGKREVAKLGMKAKSFDAADPLRGSDMLSERGWSLCNIPSLNIPLEISSGLFNALRNHADA